MALLLILLALLVFPFGAATSSSGSGTVVPRGSRALPPSSGPCIGAYHGNKARHGRKRIPPKGCAQMLGPSG